MSQMEQTIMPDKYSINLWLHPLTGPVCGSRPTSGKEAKPNIQIITCHQNSWKYIQILRQCIHKKMCAGFAKLPLYDGSCFIHCGLLHYEFNSQSIGTRCQNGFSCLLSATLIPRCCHSQTNVEKVRKAKTSMHKVTAAAIIVSHIWKAV